MRRLRHAVSRPCDAICAVLEPSAVLRLVREHGVRWSGEGKRARSPSEGAPTAHGVTLARLGERLGAHCPRRPHPAASSCMCLRALDREGVPGAPRARGGATASSPKGNRGMADRMRRRQGLGPKACAPRRPRARRRGMHEGYLAILPAPPRRAWEAPLDEGCNCACRVRRTRASPISRRSKNEVCALPCVGTARVIAHALAADSRGCGRRAKG